MSESGGAVTSEVRVDVDDLAEFVAAGGEYVAKLRDLFDDVASARRSTVAVFGGAGPDALAADPASPSDPFRRLIDQAPAINSFVDAIVDSLHSKSATTAMSLSGGTLIGADRLTPAEHLAVVDELIDGQLETIGANPDPDSVEFGIAMANLQALTEQAHQIGGATASHVANRYIEAAIETETDIGFAKTPERGRQVLATTLANQGIALLQPAEQADLVERLNRTSIRRPGWPPAARRSGLEALVDALDLDNDESVFVPYNTDATQTRHQWRVEAADQLLNATQRPDGTLSPGGSELFDLVVADLIAADGNEGDSIIGLTHESMVAGSRYGDDRVREFRLRDTLIRSTTAPNYRLSDEQYLQSLRLDALLDGDGVGLDTQIEIDAVLTSFAPDDQTRQFLVGLIAGGVPTADAIRIGRSASSAGATDRRVDVLRFLLPVDAFGNPTLTPGNDGMTRNLAGETSVLQSIQIARHNEGRPTATAPLTTEQLALVDGLHDHWDLIQTALGELWTERRQAHHRANRPNSYVTLAAIARGDLTTIDGSPVTAEIRSLANDLIDPTNTEIWAVLHAADDDAWFGPDGTYRTGRFDIDTIGRRDSPRQRLRDIGPDTFDRLAVQLFLLDQIGPSAAQLANADGVVTEDAVKAYLARHGHELPPVLADRIRVGLHYGLGEDTFGWDEIAAIAGWIGLGAAAVVTFVPSAGTSPWVTAGLVGLAAFESYAAYRTGDNLGAALATAGATADLAAAARLVVLRHQLGQPLISANGASGQAIEWLRRWELDHGVLYAGLPIPRRSRNVSTMHRSLELLDESAQIQDARQLLQALDNNSRIVGLEAWAGQMTNRDAKGIADAANEMRAMQALLNEHPNHTIRVDVDITSEDGLKSMDFEVIDPDGNVVRSVEVHNTGTVTNARQLTRGVRHAAAKADEQYSLSPEDGRVVEARVTFDLDHAAVVNNGSVRVEFDKSTGSYVEYVHYGTPGEAELRSGNLFDDFAASRLNKDPATYKNLDEIVFVDHMGMAIASIVRNPEGHWTRTS